MLFTRWMGEINPTDLGNVPSGPSGHYNAPFIHSQGAVAHDVMGTTPALILTQVPPVKMKLSFQTTIYQANDRRLALQLGGADWLWWCVYAYMCVLMRCRPWVKHTAAYIKLKTETSQLHPQPQCSLYMQLARCLLKSPPPAPWRASCPHKESGWHLGEPYLT